MQIFTITLLFLVMISAIFFLMTRARKIMFKICGILFIVSFVGSYSLYVYGFMSMGKSFADSFFSTLSGMYSASRMFIGEDDRSLVEFNNVSLDLLMISFHALALIVVQTTVTSLLARKFHDRLRMAFGSHKRVYIIKGSNHNALLLGENIAKGDNPNGRPKRDRIVIFLLEQDDDAEKTLKMIDHFGGILLVLDKIDKSHDLSDCIKKAGLGKNGLGKILYNRK